MVKSVTEVTQRLDVDVEYYFCGRVPWLYQYWPGGFMLFVVLCPGTPEGSTGSGSGFKASQKTGQRLKVSSDRLGEAGNRTCDPWFTRHRFIPYTTIYNKFRYFSIKMCKKLLLFIILFKTIYRPDQKLSILIAHASGEGPGEPAHTCVRSLDRAPVSHIHKVVELEEGLDHKLDLQHSSIRQHGLRICDKYQNLMQWPVKSLKTLTDTISLAQIVEDFQFTGPQKL